MERMSWEDENGSWCRYIWIEREKEELRAKESPRLAPKLHEGEVPHIPPFE